MRVLGVDYGEKRLGLALSDATGTVASPLAVIEATGDGEADAARVAEAARDEHAEMIVVGLPRRLSGERGQAAEAAASFAELVEQASGLRTVLWDERMTTAIAERALLAADVSRAGRRARIDKVAAALILQSYLDAHHHGEEDDYPPSLADNA